MNGETYAQEMILHVWLGLCLDVRNICLLLDTFHPSFSLSLLYPSFLEPLKRLRLSCFWRDTHLKWNYLDFFKPTYVAQGEGCWIFFWPCTIILRLYYCIMWKFSIMNIHFHLDWLLSEWSDIWPLLNAFGTSRCAGCPKAQFQCPHRHAISNEATYWPC